jgi:hypothetical protein
MVASKLLPLAAKALPRIAAKLLPKVARTITRATPRLTRGVTHITRTLHRNPQTRHLVRLVPSLARRTVASVVKRAAAGRPVTPATAARILHAQRRHVLGNPKIRRLALRRSQLMDHRFHRAGGFGTLPRARHSYHRRGSAWGPGLGGARGRIGWRGRGAARPADTVPSGWRRPGPRFARLPDVRRVARRPLLLLLRPRVDKTRPWTQPTILLRLRPAPRRRRRTATGPERFGRALRSRCLRPGSGHSRSTSLGTPLRCVLSGARNSAVDPRYRPRAISRRSTR